MKKALLIIFGTFVAAASIFAIVVAMQPNDFAVSRSAVINAPPAAVFPHVNSLRKMNDWSPWAKMDRNSKTTFEGESGKGSTINWAGNSSVGEGKMTIVESKPNERVGILLEFVKPMEGKSDVLFTFEPEGSGTKVTWNMSGENGFVGKAMCLVGGMQGMMESKFDEGLAALKETVEAELKATSTTP
jgi:uncharacterized protein YndB with AHSA1/START domain